MSLENLKKEIKRLQKSKVDKCSCNICYNNDNKLEGIKEVIKEVDQLKLNPHPHPCEFGRNLWGDDEKSWKEIKKLLKVK